MPLAGVLGHLLAFRIQNRRENGCLCSARINRTCAEVTREKSPKSCALKHCISIFFQYLTLAALEACLAPFQLINLSSIKPRSSESLGWVILPGCYAVSRCKWQHVTFVSVRVLCQGPDTPAELGFRDSARCEMLYTGEGCLRITPQVILRHVFWAKKYWNRTEYTKM